MAAVINSWPLRFTSDLENSVWQQASKSYGW